MTIRSFADRMKTAFDASDRSVENRKNEGNNFVTDNGNNDTDVMIVPIKDDKPKDESHRSRLGLNRIRSRRLSNKSKHPSTTTITTVHSDSNRTSDLRDSLIEGIDFDRITPPSDHDDINSHDIVNNKGDDDGNDDNHNDNDDGDENSQNLPIRPNLKNMTPAMKNSFKEGIDKISRASREVSVIDDDVEDFVSTHSMRGSIVSHASRLSKLILNKDDTDEDMTIWRRFRSICGILVRSATFQTSIILLIALNGLTMGITTFDFVTENPDIDRAFEILDKVFLIIFTFELVLQLVYNGIQFFCDGWLIFDFFVVILSWALESFQIVRAFRIFRAFRLIARLDVLRKLVQAIIQVIPRMYAISALLMLFNYIYAVLCTELFGVMYEEGYLDQDYFSTLDKSLFSLFQMMTLDWSSISRQVQEVYPFAWSVFTSFVLISGFFVYNLIVAVVCEAVSEIEAASKKQQKEEERAMAGAETVALNPEEERLEQLRRVKLLRARMSHLIKAQNDILSATMDTLKSTDGFESIRDIAIVSSVPRKSREEGQDDILRSIKGLPADSSDRSQKTKHRSNLSSLPARSDGDESICSESISSDSSCSESSDLM